MQRSIFVLAVALLAALPVHAGTWTVTNTADSGSSSLREAISESNASPGADTITFQIAGGGVKTITLSSALPQITDVLTIDGFTQTGASPNTSAGGLNSVILIELDCNGGAFPGLAFTGAASGSSVRGLAIGRCTNGIAIGPNASITVGGNYIGTDASGTVARGNGTGIDIDAASSGNQIGVANDLGSRNLISAHWIEAIDLRGTANAITGNLIGTTPSGMVALGNQAGIAVRGDDNEIASNLISASGYYGVLIEGDATGNIVRSSLIGTAIDGTTPFGNNVGIIVAGAPDGPTDTTITNNIIRFSDDQGILILTGNLPLRTPGGPTTHAVGDPVRIRIDDNEIRDNGALGIDLEGNGVTANDALDEDSGANERQNFPAVTSAIAAGGSLIVTGTLQSIPSSTFEVQLFQNDACDASGHGEGAFFLGEVMVTTDAGGNGSFNTTVPAPIAAGVVTATAIDAVGNTSEFSTCEAVVVADSTLSVSDMSIIEGDAGTSNAIVTVTLSPASPVPVQVSYATSNGTATSPSDYAPVSGILTFPTGTTTQTFTIPIIGDLAVEPDETINVTLSSPSNATISDGSAVVTITNDDSATAAPAAVPTLTEIGLGLFAAAIALLAFLRLR